jgi:hypothetical protein
MQHYSRNELLESGYLTRLRRNEQSNSPSTVPAAVVALAGANLARETVSLYILLFKRPPTRQTDGPFHWATRWRKDDMNDGLMDLGLNPVS